MKKKMLSNWNRVSWRRDRFRREEALFLTKKLRSKKESGFSSNHSRNSKSFIKSDFKINHRLIRKASGFKSNRNTIEIKFNNEITMFDDHENAKDFEIIINKYDSLWKKKNTFVKISKSVYMSITLKSNWIDHLKINRVYFFEIENRVFVDEIFDKLHQQRKMKWIKNFISFDYFVFVIWRITIKTKNQSKKNVSW